MQSLIQVVSENVRFYRKRTGLSQLKFAYQIGMSPSYLAEIERGKQYPSLKTLEKLAENFGIEPYVLLYPVSVDKYSAQEEITRCLRDIKSQVDELIEKKLNSLL